jgi:hypothetical protein
VTAAKPKPKPLKLAAIAARIYAHLQRFERDPKINVTHPEYRTRPYYMANAGVSGAYVFVRYVSYQGTSNLRRDEALRYLAWLDAGNVGRHYEAFREKD